MRLTNELGAAPIFVTQRTARWSLKNDKIFGYNIEGDIPDWVPKDEWPKKASGGIIETGEIARRPGAVPPLSGPSPDGIMSLYSNPKQVNVG